MLNDLGGRYDAAARHHVEHVDAMTSLHQTLTDAKRLTLFAVIGGDRLHPDVPKSFRACMDRAREACRAVRTGAAFDGEGAEADSLAGWVEEAARRGEALLASPAGDRISQYNEPDTGFQSAVSSAWRHMSELRIQNEVRLEQQAGAARTASRQAAWQAGGVSGLSLALSVLAWWHSRRPVAGAGGPKNDGSS